MRFTLFLRDLCDLSVLLPFLLSRRLRVYAGRQVSDAASPSTDSVAASCAFCALSRLFLFLCDPCFLSRLFQFRILLVPLHVRSGCRSRTKAGFDHPYRMKDSWPYCSLWQATQLAAYQNCPEEPIMSPDLTSVKIATWLQPVSSQTTILIFQTVLKQKGYAVVRGPDASIRVRPYIG